MDYLSQVNSQQFVTTPSDDGFKHKLKPKPKIRPKIIVSILTVGIVAVGTVIGLVWQSNSFIAQNQEIRSDASNRNGSSAYIVSPSQLSTVDQRFGLGGDCSIVKKLGIPWTFNWGGSWISGIVNDVEVNCTETSNGTVSSLLTVGHADSWDTNNENINSNADNALTVETKIAKADPIQKKAYDQLDQLLKTKPYAYNRPKVTSALLDIKDIIQEKKYTNAYWQVANEPDWHPYFDPRFFAQYYHIFSEHIKAYDPSAKISVGGLGWPRYNHEKKWAHKETHGAFENISGLSFNELSWSGVTSVSLFGNIFGTPDQIHVVKNGKVHSYANNTWTDVSSSLKQGSGNFTSFTQYKKSNISRQWYVRGGELWHRVNHGTGWSNFATVDTSNLPGKGLIRSLSATSEDDGKFYLVRCKEDKWNSGTTTCTDNAYRIYFAQADTNGLWKQTWTDVTSNLSSIGPANPTFFVSYSDNNLKKQYYFQDGKVWLNNGSTQVNHTELISDPFITNLVKKHPAKKALIEDSAWFLLFVHHYELLYRKSPQLDYMNIHPYPWARSVYSLDTVIEASQDSQRSINHIRALLDDSTLLNLKDIPIVITEFSQATKECSTLEACEGQPAEIVKAYIKNMTSWFKQNPDKVHKWFWFVAHDPQAVHNGQTWAQHWGSQLMHVLPNSSNPSKATAEYLSAMNSNKDTVAPQITKISTASTRKAPPQHNIIFAVSESGKADQTYEYWYCLGKTANTCDLRPWTSTLSRKKTIKLYVDSEVPGYGGKEPRFITVKVTDSAGNTSQVITSDPVSLRFPLPEQRDEARPEECPTLPEKEGRLLIVRAKGITGDKNRPKLELRIKNSQGDYELKETFELKGKGYRNYRYRIPNGSKLIKASQVRLAFVNDGPGKDVYVDWIKIGNATYQTEHCSTYSTGTWDNETSTCLPRNAKSDKLNCNGYFDFLQQ